MSTNNTQPPESNQVKYQVFVSSTFKGMDDVRKIAITAIQQCGHFHLAMEGFTAKSDKDRDVIRRAVESCDIFLLILGPNYGETTQGKATDGTDRISYTEYEYSVAESLGKPILAFMPTMDDIKKSHDKIAPTDAECRNWGKYYKFITKVREPHYVPPWTKDNLPSFGIALATAISDCARKLESSNATAGWVPASHAQDRDLVVSALHNEFSKSTIRSLNDFTKLDDRCFKKAPEKQEAAVHLATIFSSQSLITQGVDLFFESGSSVAYVAKEFGHRFTKKIYVTPSGNPNIHVTTNNILAYLQLSLVHHIPCTPFPWGFPEPPYGAYYGPISDYGEKPEDKFPIPPVYNQEDLKRLDGEINQLVSEVGKQKYGPKPGNKTLLIGAISGIQISTAHKLSLKEEMHYKPSSGEISDIEQCYGLHVGSYYNKVFKRFMYSMGSPLVIVCDASKIDAPIKVGVCHFVFDTAQWNQWIKNHPLAFCVGCENAEADATKQMFLKMGFTTKEAHSYKSCTSVFAWNPVFEREIKDWGVDLHSPTTGSVTPPTDPAFLRQTVE